MLAALRQWIMFARGRTCGLAAPRLWMLEVTNRCNLSCPMCPRDEVGFSLQDMSVNFVRKLLDENPGVEELWPYGFGESLLNPNIFEIIRHAKQKGLIVSLSTNGTILNAETARQLLDSRLDYLILAVDGATAETYETYRRGARFEHVVSNIERLLAMKKTCGSSIHITLQMIRMSRNTHELGLFRRMWRRDGVDRTRVREDLSKRSDAMPSNTRRPCFFLWRGPAFIQASGTMIPCPYYHGSEPFGDLKFQSMEEAWNSEKMVRLRQAHVSGNLSTFPVCAACPRYQPHPLIAAAGFLANTRTIRRFLPFAEDVQRRFGWKLFE